MKILVCFLAILFSGHVHAQLSLEMNESVWDGHDGKTYRVSDLNLNPYKIVTMIFTSCPSACPLMIKHLKELDKALDEKRKKQTVYLLFSIDPSDTQEQLSKFHTAMGLDQRFLLLRSSSETDIRELAMMLNFRYKKVSERMYSHGTNVYLFGDKLQLLDQVSQSYNSKFLVRSY